MPNTLNQVHQSDKLIMDIRVHMFSVVAISLWLIISTAYADKPPEIVSGSTIVNAEAVIALVSNYPDIVIIDSRIPSDRMQGYIEGSINLTDVNTDCNSLGNIIANKNDFVLFYCNGKNCGRSANAIKIAISCGYEKIYWFRGGFVEWKTKGYPFLQQ